ncbi:MAG: hypothetical protein KDJ65_25660 [Anaerolineae bacterium]|nr:hypothetical protein [Anaerolineae bacterium]
MMNKNKVHQVLTVVVVYGLGMLTCAVLQQVALLGMAHVGGLEIPVAAEQVNHSEDWKLLSSEEGNFSILFPDTPRENLRMPANSSVEETVYVFQTDVENVSYQVSYSDYIEDNTANTINTRLDAARDTLVAELSAQVVEEVPNVVDGFHGRQIKFSIVDEDTAGGKVGVVQLCLVEDRLYQVAVIGPVNAYSRADAEQFMTSFTLLEQPNVEALVH